MADNMSILIADDDQDDCLLFKDALNELQILSPFTIVNDGQQLMQHLIRAESLPDVLFLDLNMPRKNGITCLAEIKKHKKLQDLKVIIFSTSLDDVVGDILYENGAHYYICKPTSFTLWKKIIAKVLSLVQLQNTPRPARENFLIGSFNSIL